MSVSGFDSLFFYSLGWGLANESKHLSTFRSKELFAIGYREYRMTCKADYERAKRSYEACVWKHSRQTDTPENLGYAMAVLFTTIVVEHTESNYHYGIYAEPYRYYFGVK